jgi:hypothetical protein
MLFVTNLIGARWKFHTYSLEKKWVPKGEGLG